MRTEIRTRLAVLLTLASLACGMAWAQPSEGDKAIRERLDRAQQKKVAGAEQLLPMERDLLWLLNFEDDDIMLAGGGGMIPVRLDHTHYAPGRFGRGFFFEQPRQNALPPEMADVEDDLGGFSPLGGGRLAPVATDTAFGKSALAVTMPAAGDGLTTKPVPILFNRHAPWATQEVHLLASCYLKGPKDARVKLEARLTPAELLDTKTKQPVADRKPDATAPQTITLTGEWQRAACWATGDARLTQREGVFSLTSLVPGALNLLADGFQFQQGNYTSNPGFIPTTWITGGTSAPATWLDLTDPAVVNAFPIHEGTVSFYTRSPHPLGPAWFSFDASWGSDLWTLGTYVAYAGKQKGDRPLYTAGLMAGVEDGKWHHVALSWDATKGSVYKDGKCVGTLDRQDVDITRVLDGYHLRIGGDINSTSANAVLDEVAAFKRKLSDDEIARLAAAVAPLRVTGERFAVSPGPRTTYYRDEAGAPLEVSVRALTAPPGEVTVDCAVGELWLRSKPITLSGPQVTARFEFPASQLKCGTYQCRAAVTGAGGGCGYAEWPLVVTPALHQEHFLMSTWGSGIASTDWLPFLHNLGLNCVDTDFSNVAAVNALGQEGFLYNWHYNFGQGDWSPANREVTRAQTRGIAEQLAPLPNWRGTLLNTETGPGVIPPADQRKAWFDDWARRELGFPLPEKGWKLLTPNNPNVCWFEEGKQPGPDGIFEQPPDSARVIKWWDNRGGAVWRNNALASSEMKKLRPDLINWTDPMSAPGEIADLDAGSSWSYHIWSEDLIGEFETAYWLTHSAGKEKEFYATLGMDYVAGDWLTVTEPDGKKKVLEPTPDDMMQWSWIVTAHIPSDGLTIWLLNGWFNGLRGEPIPWDRNGPPLYCPPGSDVALGKVLKEDPLPLGTMLKHVPNAPRPVAVLYPDSTLWLTAGEGGWWWGIVHYMNQWNNWLNKSGLPHDLVGDDVAPGELAKYRAVIFPMGLYVSRNLYNELVAAGKAGTKIIVDDHCRQTYPNMERWPQKYTPPGQGPADYGLETQRRLGELRDRLRPEFDAYAVGAEGPVIVNFREAQGVKYVSVINNNRQAGPYTQWTKKDWFKPYGKAQQATVYVRAPEGAAIYEFTTSTRLKSVYREGHHEVTVDLPPHAGRLLCVYPSELSALSLEAPGEVRRGASEAIRVSLSDRQGQPARGRQLLEVRVVDPAGEAHDESGIYRMEDGKATIPFRPALNDAPGAWQIALRERTSGLTKTVTLPVR